MSERKLYFPGLGGNRYEIELEELQRQAYKGKIKRDDKIIVVKIKNGVTSEIETTCGQIRVVSDAFEQGEADRKAEAERKAAEKRAKEAAKLAHERIKEETRIREKETKKNRRGKISKKTRKMLSLSGDDAFSQAHKGASFLLRLVDIVLWIIVALNLFCLLFFVGLGLYYALTESLLEGVGVILGVVFWYAVFFGLLYLFRKIISIAIWFPLQIAVYQVNSIKKALGMVDNSLTGKSEGENFQDAVTLPESDPISVPPLENKS